MIFKLFQTWSIHCEMISQVIPPGRSIGIIICPGKVLFTGRMGVWQRFPVNVDGHEHVHWHPAVFTIRVPLFWHVIKEHMSNGASHREPEKRRT